MTETLTERAYTYVIYERLSGRVVYSGVSSAPTNLLREGLSLLLDVYLDDPTSYYINQGVPVAKGTPPSRAHTFDYTTKQWVDPRTLSDLQVAKWEQIKRARVNAEFGGFTWDGSPFDSDAISQSRIQGAVQMAAMAPGFTIDWTLANNSVRNLNGEDLANVGAALGMHIAAQHANARLLRSQIEAATTVAEVDAVTW